MTILCIFICINVLVVITSAEFSPLTQHNTGDYYDNRLDIDLEEKDDFKVQYSDVDDTFGPNMLVKEEATADYSFDTVKKEVNANKRFDINEEEENDLKILYSDEDDAIEQNRLVRNTLK